MNRGTVRQGFALITAVVITAAILATIVGIATLTVRETRVQAEQNASDQALAVAERGLADVVSRLKTDLAIEAIDRPKDVAWEPRLSIDSDGTEVSTVKTGAHSFYWVKVVPTSYENANKDRDYAIYAAGFIVRPKITDDEGNTTYDSLALKALAASTTDVIARRIVSLTSYGIVKWETSEGTPLIPGNPGTQGDLSWPFSYGLFTGETFNMVGSKNLANVTTSGTSGMYAVQDITMTSNHTLSNADLFAEHAILAEGITVVGGTLDSISHRPAPGTATFPKLDLEAYMDLFDAFVSGTAPFNGSKDDYPDLSLANVRSAVLTALGDPQNSNVTVDGQIHHFVTPASLSNYTDQVVSGSLVASLEGSLKPNEIIALQALSSTLSKSVFYVRDSGGDKPKDADATWTSDRANLAGVIVCSGNVRFTGCPDFASGQVAAILAQGNIDIAGSTKDVSRGIFYAEGTVKYAGGGKDNEGTGQFEGQIISQGTVKFDGGGGVTFKNYSSMLGGILPGGKDPTPDTPPTLGTAVISGFESFTQEASSWTEKAWLDFLNLPA